MSLSSVLMGMLEKVALGLQPALVGIGVNQISSAKVSPDTFIKLYYSVIWGLISWHKSPAAMFSYLFLYCREGLRSP